jgi:hypothetical protein
LAKAKIAVGLHTAAVQTHNLREEMMKGRGGGGSFVMFDSGSRVRFLCN